MKRIGLLILLLLVLGAGFLAVRKIGETGTATPVSVAAASAAAAAPARAKSTAALLTLTSVSGKPITINPNQKTVLHFMVSSCTSCVATEIRLTKFDRLSGVRIISVDVDPQVDNLTTIHAFRQATGATWPYVMDTHQALIDKFHITQLDTVLVLYHNRVIFNQVAPAAAVLRKALT